MVVCVSSAVLLLKRAYTFNINWKDYMIGVVKTSFLFKNFSRGVSDSSECIIDLLADNFYT